jgi:hypothetical protein
VVKKTTLFELALENLDDLYGNKDYFNVYLNPKKKLRALDLAVNVARVKVKAYGLSSCLHIPVIILHILSKDHLPLQL